MKDSKLLSSFNSKNLNLKNHVVMAPMTRARAVVRNTPNDLMTKYYSMRASTGLIITEGTAPSRNGVGSANMPAIYTNEQINGWREVVNAVHENGGKIFLQIMHSGRSAHELNLPEGAEILGPSAIPATGEIFTLEGPKPMSTPREMTKTDIEQAQEEHVQAAKNAIDAGFDGVEIHAANGYLGQQFLNKVSNQRTDEYGGSEENRCRFIIELLKKVARAIGSEKTGLRISPYNEFNDMAIYDDIPKTYEYLIMQLNTLNLAYLHMAGTGRNIPYGFFDLLAKKFNNNVIFNGGYGFNLPLAEKVVSSSDRYIISIGYPFIANPDLIERIRLGVEYNEADQNTLYTPGEDGYLTYPTLVKS